MHDDDLILDMQLPRGGIRVVVSPAALAPWTSAFWRRTPAALQPMQRVYRLARAGERYTIESPAGLLSLAPSDAESSWDALQRAVLLHLTGAPLLHAALLARDDGTALVIAGGNGAGKTTLALALWQRGWTLDADDWVQVDWRGVRGVGRPLDRVPPRAAVAWHYTARALQQAQFAHAEAAPAPWRCWRDVRAVVWLAAERAATPAVTRRLPHVSASLWVLPPRLRHAAAVWRLFRKPWWCATAGGVEATATALAALAEAPPR